MQNNANRKPRMYSEKFKRDVVEEYLAGNLSKQDLIHKYDLGGNSAILSWMRKLGYVQPELTVASKFVEQLIPPDLSKKKQVESASELQQRIKELERQLQDAKLQAEAYARIIEKAEKEMKIPIRKKPNTR